jgi:hypothetical protein
VEQVKMEHDAIEEERKALSLKILEMYRCHCDCFLSIIFCGVEKGVEERMGDIIAKANAVNDLFNQYSDGGLKITSYVNDSTRRTRIVVRRMRI